MITHDMEQGSPEWHEIKLGKFSGSFIDGLFSAPSTLKYRHAINRPVFERLTGKRPEDYTNSWMQRGINMEPEARLAYELETFNKVEEVGFIELNEWVGCSPDGLIGDSGGLEIKCTKWSTHMHYLTKKELPKIYFWQVHSLMWIADLEWVDFVSYHPDLPIFIHRVMRDEKVINTLRHKLEESIDKAEKLYYEYEDILNPVASW